jgi:hypothetical protein
MLPWNNPWTKFKNVIIHEKTKDYMENKFFVHRRNHDYKENIKF